MDAILQSLLQTLLSGGPQAIMAILIFVIIGLFWERKRLLEEISSKDKKIEKIIDDYYTGNMTLSDALISLKLVLYEIKSRF